jgi:hypothetical protein
VKFHVCTTMTERGWNETGRRMAESFIARWPGEAKPLTVYAEDFDIDMPGVEVRRLPAWMAEFKQRHKNVPAFNGMRNGAYDYRWDAVKFAHKVAALTDFGMELTDGVMVWLDADTYTHADVTVEWLEGLFPEPAYLAWLDRFNSHPECGFVLYRASHPYHRHFMESYRGLYLSGDLFKLEQTNDCTALQHVVQAKMLRNKIPAPVSLSGAAKRTGHVLANSELSTRIDHMKGPRKAIGRTPKGQRFMIQDGNPYWT